MVKIKIKFRKSQAALEFLTTYGWAFLVILIMIGTLAYFGILSPVKLLPDRCSTPTQFQCLDYVITSSAGASSIRMRLRNGVGEPIAVQSIGFSTDGTTAFTCTAPTLPSTANPWRSGNVTEFVYSNCVPFGGLSSGEKSKVAFSILYYAVSSGSTYLKEANGEVFTTIR